MLRHHGAEIQPIVFGPVAIEAHARDGWAVVGIGANLDAWWVAASWGGLTVVTAFADPVDGLVSEFVEHGLDGGVPGADVLVDDGVGFDDSWLGHGLRLSILRD